jgi:hypothetical protein
MGVAVSAVVHSRHVFTISPLLSNLYLTEVGRMLERAKEATRRGKYTYVEYARFADDLVILIDAYPRHDWLMAAVEKRLREELADLAGGGQVVGSPAIPT